MPAKSCRILVADDHHIVRRGIRSLLEHQPGLEICAEAVTGSQAVEYIKRDHPDIVILDLTMPDLNGLEVIDQMREHSPQTAAIILTMHFSEELAREVLRAGAMAFVLKSDADTELIAAIDHVRHKQPYFTPTLAETMARSFLGGPDGGSDDESAPIPGTPLTPREVQVVQLLAQGKSNKEVATALDVSTRTIESHRNHIMQKMKFGSFSDLVRFAVRHNLVEL